MSEFDEYYTELNKLELVTIPEWVFYPGGSRIDRPCVMPDTPAKNEMDLWLDSYVIALVGHRGAGKTTLASALAIRSKWLWPEMRIVSNFPMKWAIKDSKGELQENQSEPLDLVKMINFDADYQHCLIVLDEAPAILNRMGAATNRNRLLNLWIQQLRKNQDSLILCSQDFKLIDYEAQYQTDVIVYCKDASRRYPESGVKRGGVVLMDVLDHSGQWTGYPYDERHKVYRKRLNSEYVWGTFNTYFQLDILAQLWRLEMQKQTYSLESGGAVKGKQEEDTYLLVADALIQQAVSTGQDSIDSRQFFKELGATKAQKDEIGRRLVALGCSRERPEGSRSAWRYTNLKKYSPDSFLRTRQTV